jgi:hypothetical protein
MEEIFKGTAMRVPSVVQWLDRLHHVLDVQKDSFHHPALALLREHLGLLPDEDEVLNDLLPGLGHYLTTKNALRQILEGLRHVHLAALLQSCHYVDQVGHRSADGTFPQVAAHRAPAYHRGRQVAIFYAFFNV